MTCFREYGTAIIMQGADIEAYDPVNKVFDQIYGFVLCQKLGISSDTFTENYLSFCNEAVPHLAPSILLSVADGIVMFADEKGALLRNAVGAKKMCLWLGIILDEDELIPERLSQKEYYQSLKKAEALSPELVALPMGN